MKKKIFALALISCFVLHAGELILAKNGKTDYVIAFAGKPTDVEQYAAKELRFFLKEITGADFQIGSVKPGKSIIIGGSDVKDIKECVIKTENGNVKLYGGGIHGALNAVYELIENKFGCMFLSAWGEMHIPKQKTLKLAEGTYRTKYAFPLRGIISVSYKDHQKKARAFYRNRINMDLDCYYFKTALPMVTLEPGIVNAQVEFCREHSLERFMPAGEGMEFEYSKKAKLELKKKQYFKKHPEWFSMDENGKRVPNRQVCFSNPELKRELEKNAMDFYAEQKKRRGCDGVLQISCNDIAYNMCFCPKCKDLQKKYKCEGAPLFKFMIDLSNKYPDIQFRTLAYQRGQTQSPPVGMVIPKNLSFFFAPINADFANSLVEGEKNQRDLDDLKKWSKLTKKILIWYYPNPYNRAPAQFFIPPPTAMLDRIAADIKLFRDLGIDGPYFEHDSGGVRFGTNFSELQTYVLSKLMQNPDLDVDKLVRRFISAYYGSGAAWVQKYHDELQNEMRNFVKNNGTWDYRSMDSFFLTENNLLRWDSYLTQAEKVTNGNSLFHVKLLRLGLDSTLVSKFSDNVEKRIARMDATFSELHKKRLAHMPARAYAAWKKNMRNRKESKPIPVQFQNKEILVYEVPIGARSMEDKDGSIAMYEKWDGKSFCLGVYDRTTQKYHGFLTVKADSVKDDKYNYYRFSKPVVLTPSLLLFGGKWLMQFPLGEKFQHDSSKMMTQKWHVYVSLKFTSGQVLADRAILVATE